jgi:predicted chitinase
MIDPILFTHQFEQLFSSDEEEYYNVNNALSIATTLTADHMMVYLRWKAYALATVLAECGGNFQPITEEGDPAYFSKYAVGTDLGKALGNTEIGDDILYKGRGYVQITGRKNYQRFTYLLNVDLVNDPDLALQKQIAYQILSAGMTRGLFTGIGLLDYINASKCDYVNSRRIINGLDRAKEIANNAIKFQSCLEASTIY